jgi:hypothetical protein
VGVVWVVREALDRRRRRRPGKAARVGWSLAFIAGFALWTWAVHDWAVDCVPPLVVDVPEGRTGSLDARMTMAVRAVGTTSAERVRGERHRLMTAMNDSNGAERTAAVADERSPAASSCTPFCTGLDDHAEATDQRTGRAIHAP